MWRAFMSSQGVTEVTKVVSFGRRKVRPRVCIADSKPHIRTFLVNALEELGFVTCECERAIELGAVLGAQQPDLVVLGLSAGGVEAGKMLKTLAAGTFDGKVLLLGPHASPAAAAIEELAEQLGIAMLPALWTPFGEMGLRDSVATFLPIEGMPDPPIHADEAVRAGWLELWYQPQIDTRSLALSRAEALIRIRHPAWGVVAPAYFIPGGGDPQFRALSEFVIRRAIEDWRYFITQRGSVDIAINLPIAFLQDPESVKRLCQQMPNHPAFDGLIIEIKGTEIVRNLEFVKKLARQLRFHNIGISIADLGAEWPLLAGLDDFPFVEIKVDRTFVTGCATDRLKQTVCRRILDLADGYGSRTVAAGVETRADFLTVREMGFHLMQGFLFAKPATAQKFARTTLGRPMRMPR
jgi:EAL domain-containing protein (putative c-di-GMP-specific phosphodiesterase class I)/CheY-like chemotaxis protein